MSVSHIDVQSICLWKFTREHTAYETAPPGTVVKGLEAAITSEQRSQANPACKSTVVIYAISVMSRLQGNGIYGAFYIWKVLWAVKLQGRDCGVHGVFLSTSLPPWALPIAVPEKQELEWNRKHKRIGTGRVCIKIHKWSTNIKRDPRQTQLAPKVTTVNTELGVVFLVVQTGNNMD
jgi:hypothetical protein